MRIRLKKLSDGVVLACIRDSGAAVQRTGHGGFFALHDLLHYAVETTLGCREGFFGLMAAGWEFENFTRRDDPRYRAMPREALMVENLVGIMTTVVRENAALDGELLPVVTEDVNRDLRLVVGEGARVISEAEVAEIVRRFKELAGQWNSLAEGDVMELEFGEREFGAVKRVLNPR